MKSRLLRGWGQLFCDFSSYAVVKSVTKEMALNNINICVTSFMDDPLGLISFAPSALGLKDETGSPMCAA